MGPLQGVRIVEMSGIGPAPFCGMLLADLGADVLRVDRLGGSGLGFPIAPRFDLLNRGKRAAAIDLKRPEGVALVKRLIARADMLIEGFRPGVMERLGLGPDVCCALNPRLILGRMTGFGQTGPMKDQAGHDINYIAMSGALAAIGEKGGAPLPPMNLVGDFAGGSLYLAMGLLAALHEAKSSGRGQVIDAAMVDGVASLMAMVTGYRQAGIWRNERGANGVDGGAPWYATYATADGRYMAVGAIEAKFYAEFLDKLGLAGEALPKQNDMRGWDVLRARFAAAFATKTRDEWAAIFAHGDACVTPVLDMDECMRHPLNVERGNHVAVDGVSGPAPAPKFSRTPGAVRCGVMTPEADTQAALADWGIAASECAQLAEAGVVPRG
ncbi:MAG: CoA transferase [Methylobacteriaceae bacterium]|nr:CoA transferase [Methylobacteriaceae bacterium]